MFLAPWITYCVLFGSPCSASSLLHLRNFRVSRKPCTGQVTHHPSVPLCTAFSLSDFWQGEGPLTRSQQEIVQEGETTLRIEIFDCWLPSCLANFCAASLLISKSDLPLDFFPRPSVYPLSSGPKNSLTSSIGLPNLAK